jgi:hypothetical protein
LREDEGGKCPLGFEELGAHEMYVGERQVKKGGKRKEERGKREERKEVGKREKRQGRGRKRVKEGGKREERGRKEGETGRTEGRKEEEKRDYEAGNREEIGRKEGGMRGNRELGRRINLRSKTYLRHVYIHPEFRRKFPPDPEIPIHPPHRKIPLLPPRHLQISAHVRRTRNFFPELPDPRGGRRDQPGLRPLHGIQLLEVHGPAPVGPSVVLLCGGVRGLVSEFDGDFEEAVVA